MTWTVHKFGGTSLADAKCFQQVANIVLSQPDTNRAVVVSAVGGVTNLLFNLIETASAQETTSQLINELRTRYEVIVTELLTEQQSIEFMGQFENDLTDIDSVLKALSLGAKACSGGRMYLYALAAGGQKGVEKAMLNLRNEIERDMKLMGVTSVDQLSRKNLRFR